MNKSFLSTQALHKTIVAHLKVSTHACKRVPVTHLIMYLCACVGQACFVGLLYKQTWGIVLLSNIRLILQVRVTCLRSSMSGPASNDHLVVLGD